MHHTTLTSPQSLVRLKRFLVAALSTVALTLGGLLIGTTAANAGPDDPITFQDVNLRNAVNAKLGQNPGDPITEAQAASIAQLDVTGKSITSLEGAQYLTGLDVLYLGDNQITDVSPLSSLIQLRYLNLTNNSVTNIAPLGNISSLVSLYLNNNQVDDLTVIANMESLLYLQLNNNHISDISPLVTATELRLLHLSNNHISDISPLAELYNLNDVSLVNQELSLPSAPMDAPTVNPVFELNNQQVPVSSTDAGFTYHQAAGAWAFNVPGAKTVTWSTSVSIPDSFKAEFSGSIRQDITEGLEVEEFSPEDPEVIQVSCVAGEVVAPELLLPETEGISYTLEGTVEPGATVEVYATLDGEGDLVVEPDSDWVGDDDLTQASLAITLNDVFCEAPPVIEEGSETPATIETVPRVSPQSGALPATGASGATAWLIGLGAVLLTTGIAMTLVKARHRSHE